jgi:hypothetical protein
MTRKFFLLLISCGAWASVAYGAGAPVGHPMGYVPGLSNGTVDLAAPGPIGEDTPSTGKFTTVTAGEFISNAANGYHQFRPYNSISFAGTPLIGMLQTTDTGPEWYDASWVKILTEAKNLQHFGWAIGDRTTDLTTGTTKEDDHMPCTFTVTGVRGSLSTVATGATLLTIDVNEAGTSILSTKLTFDASESTTTTAATPAVISDTTIANNAVITFDIDAVGSTTTGKGAKVWLDGYCAN